MTEKRNSRTAKQDGEPQFVVGDITVKLEQKSLLDRIGDAVADYVGERSDLSALEHQMKMLAATPKDRDVVRQKLSTLAQVLRVVIPKL